MAECFLQANPSAHIILCHYKEDHLRLRQNLGRCTASWSFGADFTQRHHNAMIDHLLQIRREEMEDGHQDLVSGGLIFAAAGNYDESKRGEPDLPDDMTTPQTAWRRLFPNILLIGSCDPYDGTPSLFSSDSIEEPPDVAYPGENIKVFDPTQGRHVFIAGTSPATQFAAGHILRTLGPDVTPERVRLYWSQQARIAEGWPRGSLHRKNGFGAFLLEDVA
jgi:hypothetical protein